MANEIGGLNLDLIKWLDEKKKKIMMKVDDSGIGMEIYVEDKIISKPKGL